MDNDFAIYLFQWYFILLPFELMPYILNLNCLTNTHNCFMNTHSYYILFFTYYTKVNAISDTATEAACVQTLKLPVCESETQMLA